MPLLDTDFMVFKLLLAWYIMVTQTDDGLNIGKLFTENINKSIKEEDDFK